MECPFCSADIVDDANFCPHCGHGVAASQTGRAPAPGPASGGEEVADPSRRAAHDDPARGDAHDDETVAIDLSDTGEIPTVDTGGILVGEAGGAPTGRVARAASGPPTGPMRRCRTCGAQNSARRDRCGRCGADLETGVARRPRHAGASDDEPADAAADVGRSTRIVIAVLVVGAIIGTLAGLVAMSRVGDDPAAEGSAFDEGVYGDESRTLEVSSVTASSTRDPVGERRFDAASVTDGDAATAWVAAVDDGVGETVALRLQEPSWVGSVSFWNGDQLDDHTFRQRGRPTTVLIHVGGTPRYEVTLLDRPGEQAVTFPDPTLGRSVVVEVVDVAAGEDGAEAALSGLELRGWVARGADREG